MNNIVIYRRDNISIAYTDGNVCLGSNFNVWYGYSNQSCEKQDMIIDASIIKKDMEDDLSSYDHICINVSNAYDIFVVMTEISTKIFNNAISKKRELIFEVIVENLYGDYVRTRKNGTIITTQFVCDKKNNNIFILNDDSNRINMCVCNEDMCFGEVTYLSTTTRENIINFLKEQNNCIELTEKSIVSVSTKNLPANIIYTTIMSPKSYQCCTLCCIEHFSHDLSLLFKGKKCSRLHGHSYVCKVTVKDELFTLRDLSNLNNEIRKLLKSVFKTEKIITTCENVVDFLFERLSVNHKIIMIELQETDNIKVVKYLNCIEGDFDD